MHTGQLLDHRTRSASRCLAALVAMDLISPQEANEALRKANGDPPIGSQRRTQLAWLLADDIEYARRDQPIPSIGDILGRIVGRATRQRESVWGWYCPLYQPDLLRAPPPEPGARWTARRRR